MSPLEGRAFQVEGTICDSAFGRFCHTTHDTAGVICLPMEDWFISTVKTEELIVKQFSSIE